MTYGAFNEKKQIIIKITEMRILKWIYDVTCLDRIKNEV